MRKSGGNLTTDSAPGVPVSDRVEDFAEILGGWFWETDAAHRFTFLSKSVEAITGIRPEWHYGKTREDLGAPSSVDKKDWAEHLASLTRHEAFKDFTFLRSGPDRYNWLRTSGKPVFDTDGTFQGYRGIAEDVTEQIETERRLTMMMESIEQLEEIFVLWDADDKLVFCNKRFREINETAIGSTEPGVTAEEHFRIALGAGMYQNAEGREEEWLAERMARHRNPSGPFEVGRQGGRWLQINEQRFADGETVTISTDITDLKKQEIELLKARKLAEDADQAKSLFLATMSHEIRTPMTSILGFSNLLVDDELPSDSQEKVSKIKTAAQSLLTIINDILDMSKLDAGKITLENIDFDLSVLIRDTLELFKDRLTDDKPISLRFEHDSSYPKWMNGDPTRLKQMFINLVGNAVKFTTEGEVLVTAKLHNSSDSPPQILFEVKDSGIGIAPEHIETLFDEFTQGDGSSTKKYEGTGLGLAICKRLVGLVGGDIGVESEVGVGSRFWFTWPYQDAETKSSEDIDLPSSFETEEIQRGLNILAAEDVVPIQMIIETTLQHYGHQITIVGNGREAIDAAKKTKYDIILMDIRMPEINGMDAMRIIRSTSGPNAETPIIALTADATTDNVSRYLEAGMNDAISKPFEPETLIGGIDRLYKKDSGPEEATNASGAAGEKKICTGGVGDESRLTAMLESLGEENSKHLLEMAIVTAEEKHEALLTAIDQNDSQSINEIAHTLKGSFGTFYCTQLMEEASWVQNHADDISKIVEFLPHFNQTVEATIAWLRSHI